jgi:glycine betaine catabolism B
MILKLLRKQPEGGNIWSFTFAPETRLTWIAGQFIRLELPHANPDNEGAKRYFTIASPPHERTVQITTRITQSSFKQALASLPHGGEARLLDLPSGDFIWPQTDQPLLFAAQGIGITPFRSMLHSRHHHGLPLAATLLYANLTNPIPFASELAELAATHPELQIIYAHTPITATALAQLHPQFANHVVYVSGPGKLLELLGPPHNLPVARLKHDFFPNYSTDAY